MSGNLSSPDHPRSLPPIPPPPGVIEKHVYSLGVIQAMLFGALAMCLMISTTIALCLAFGVRNQCDAMLIELRTHIAAHQKN